MDGRRRPLPGGQPGGKSNPVYQETYWELLGRDCVVRLIEPLEAIFRDAERGNTTSRRGQRPGTFCARRHTPVGQTAGEGDAGTIDAILFPLVVGTEDPATVAFLQEQIALQPSDDLSEADRVALGRQRAGAGITLLRRGEQQAVLDVRRLDDDPEALTIVHRCQDRGVSAVMLLDTLDHVDRLWQPGGTRNEQG